MDRRRVQHLCSLSVSDHVVGWFGLDGWPPIGYHVMGGLCYFILSTIGLGGPLEGCLRKGSAGLWKVCIMILHSVKSGHISISQSVRIRPKTVTLSCMEEM